MRYHPRSIAKGSCASRYLLGREVANSSGVQQAREQKCKVQRWAAALGRRQRRVIAPLLAWLFCSIHTI